MEAAATEEEVVLDNSVRTVEVACAGGVVLMLKGPRRRVELCGEETQISPRCESAHWPRVSGFAMATCTPGRSCRQACGKRDGEAGFLLCCDSNHIMRG